MYKDKLKEIRDELNLNQQKVANIIGVHRGRYSQYETEIDIIPIKHLITLADYFNISIDYLFGFNTNKTYANMKNMNSKLSGVRLREFRKKYKLTQDSLALILNCSYGTIAGYESGRYLIATPFLYAICKKYKISADYLLGKIDVVPKWCNNLAIKK